MGKSAKVHKRTVRPRKALPGRTLAHDTRCPNSNIHTSEKDDQQCQRLLTDNIRDVSITVAPAVEVEICASASNRRCGIRDEKIIEGEGCAGKEVVVHGTGVSARGCAAAGAAVTAVDDWVCARRCGLRGHRVGQSAARARGGTKVAPRLNASKKKGP
jgi:hypothetical protein